MLVGWFAGDVVSQEVVELHDLFGLIGSACGDEEGTGSCDFRKSQLALPRSPP